MKFFIYLLLLTRRPRITAAHDDNLRAGKDATPGLLQHGCWNSLLL